MGQFEVNVPDFKKKVMNSHQIIPIIPEGDTITIHFPLSTFNWEKPFS